MGGCPSPRACWAYPPRPALANYQVPTHDLSKKDKRPGPIFRLKYDVQIKMRLKKIAMKRLC